MPFRDGADAPDDWAPRNRAENSDRHMREFWRELAGLITLFDGASPANILAGEVGEFFRKSAPGRTRT
jgi:hypothetical protein